MNIPAIKPFLYTPQQKPSTNFCARKELKADTVEFNPLPPYESALKKLNKINKAEYDSLTYEEKNALKFKILSSQGILLRDTALSEDLPLHHFAANSIKTVFDEQYGENNYVVITIGRSLSSISKLLEMKIGEDNVKNIPMSEIDDYYSGDNQAYYSNAISNFTEKYGFEDFKKYLSSIGLDKETVNNSGKNYIIMDYTHTGKSLLSAYSILTCDELLGNEKRNITTASMQDIASMTDEIQARRLDAELAAMRYKNYSFVDRFSGRMTNLNTVIDHNKFGNKIAKETIKLFGFMLLDTQYGKYPIENDLYLTKKYTSSNIWNSPNHQYKVDTYEDIQEVFKLIKRLEKPSGYICQDDDFYTRFDTIESKSNLKNISQKIQKHYYERNLNDKFGKDDYYSEFRPKLLKYLSTLNEKFPAKN